jgi:hypothetical protein
LNIRQATFDDLEWLITVCAQRMIKEELKHPHIYDYTASLVFIENMLRGQGIVFIAEENGIKAGAIGGIITQHPYNFNIVLLNESFWYVLPEFRMTSAGAKLLNTFTSWGEAKKEIDEISLSLLPSSPPLFKSLEKKGYKLNEYILYKIKGDK